ncbi:hypothetical protein K469DRAFT_748203 [Zopfia rhizophila CBS 207.26]|uniref:Uncharacterized protein n=1 Tax=Zopfia rhizophila CBS 207.26 TaxID=1314779 RepID=A0A6A6EEG6_9PEZI|nr:hypothetical protein K469DRAFT_748203 [Zopfia rhizophila CBS 207.26]
MAPRRGGGGGGICTGGSSASCRGAFQHIGSIEIPYFVCWCIMFVVAVGTLYTTFKIKKKHLNAKKLLGWRYGIALFLYVLGYGCRIIATVLQECGTSSIRSYFHWAIAYNIFFILAYFLLLYIVLHGVNIELRNCLGNNPKFLWIIYGVVLGFMFILTVAYIGLSSYNLWAIYGEDSRTNRLILSNRRLVTGSLAGWVAVLTFSMTLWVIFNLAQVAAAQQHRSLGLEVSEAFHYIITGFQAISFIAILFIAKSRALAQAPDSHDQPVMYQNPGYPNGGAPVQPVYNQLPVPAPQQQYNSYGMIMGMGRRLWRINNQRIM